LDTIHYLTTSRDFVLRINLEDWVGNTAFAQYRQIYLFYYEFRCCKVSCFRFVSTNVDPHLITDQRNFRAKYLQNVEEN